MERDSSRQQSHEERPSVWDMQKLYEGTKLSVFPQVITVPLQPEVTSNTFFSNTLIWIYVWTNVTVIQHLTFAFLRMIPDPVDFFSGFCHRELNTKTPLKFVHSSFHGVGHNYVQQAFKVFGFQPPIPVPEQKDPDPNFSTVRCPNPEEGESVLVGKSKVTWPT